ncbi:hypothetical protein [Novipirellula galeiformis]|nr:hypothetical protein [Novipirellula galeiformis]
MDSPKNREPLTRHRPSKYDDAMNNHLDLLSLRLLRRFGGG